MAPRVERGELSREQVEATVVQVIAFIKDIDPGRVSGGMLLYRLEPDEGDDMPSLDLDSLDALEFTLALENQFESGIPEEIDYARFKTVDDIIDFVLLLASERTS